MDKSIEVISNRQTLVMVRNDSVSEIEALWNSWGITEQTGVTFHRAFIEAKRRYTANSPAAQAHARDQQVAFLTGIAAGVELRRDE